MSRSKSYTGIDYVRLVCAYLIIAIHTSPLSSVSAEGDFIFTRIIARLAVPFFFMTSGFFLISRYSHDDGKLTAFIKKTALIYMAAIVLYLPINIYNDYFQMSPLLPGIIKDIFFDGTLYHLWYLPASVMGGAAAWFLVRKIGYGRALAVSSVLYIVGLFGDSYYGIAEKIPVLNSFYELVFEVSDYTRNGIFFAPVFFVAGGYAADKGRELPLAGGICGFGISFALMFGEAMTLHGMNLQRHDSMYVFLVPAVYFLFHVILHFRGKRLVRVRNLSLVIYMIHPMIIVMIRLFAKVLHLENLLVENSMVHYLAVCAASTLAGALITIFMDNFKPGRKKNDTETDRAWVEVNLNNLEHNVRELWALLPDGCKMMAVVKAQAYGHGAYEIAVHLNKMGIRDYAVATLEEGIELRKYGIRGEILILGYTAPCRAFELKKYDLTQTLISFEYANILNKQKNAVKAHIKIDTGMHRLGISCEEISKIKKIFSMKNIHVCGMFTHLCCADSRKPEDEDFTWKQIDSFYYLTDKLEKSGISVPKLHIQSSYGFLNYPELACDYVRIGIALYGVLSSPEDETVLKPDLRPVLSLKSRVTLVRTVKKGESIGYGRVFTAQRDSRIAMLSIGYGDGYSRKLSCGKGSVFIGGKKAPVVGRVCMDQLAVDVTDIEDAARGDVAVLIGMEGCGEPSAPAVAAAAGSISNELMCRMGRRLQVVVKEPISTGT